MNLQDFTQPIENGMRVRHDAQARITVKTGRKVLEDRLIGIESVGGAMTVASFTYNALTMSGGTSWWNPTTGKPIDRPKVSVRVRPEDVLTGELCTCPMCS